MFGMTFCLLTACEADAKNAFLRQWGAEGPDCLTSADCANDEICTGMGSFTAKCVPVRCENGKEAKNHDCVCPQGVPSPDGGCGKTKCSSVEDCADIEVCVNPGTAVAACVALNCPVDEKPRNHVCVKKTCADFNDRYKTNCTQTENKTPVGRTGSDGDCFLCGSNGQCAADADCPPDELCTDGKCVPLVCPVCQMPEDHRCISLNNCCETQMDCPKFNKCVSGRCVEKTCAEINSSYGTSCPENHKITKTDIKGSDGKCVKCVKKTCAEINPSYKPECPEQFISVPLSRSVVAADGNCRVCRRRPCSTILPVLNRKCSENEKPVPTAFIGFEGICHMCKDKNF